MKGAAGGLAIVTFAFALAALAGCDARSLQRERDRQRRRGQRRHHRQRRDGGTSPGLPVTCPATCEQPAGTVYPFATVGEIYTTLAGAWQFCARDGLSYPGPPT